MDYAPVLLEALQQKMEREREAALKLEAEILREVEETDSWEPMLRRLRGGIAGRE
jgi:hypothetical protein